MAGLSIITRVPDQPFELTADRLVPEGRAAQRLEDTLDLVDVARLPLLETALAGHEHIERVGRTQVGIDLG